MFKRLYRRRSPEPELENVVDIRLLLFINIVVAAFAPILVKVWNAHLFTPAEEVFFALVCFIVLTVFEISLVIRGVTRKIRSDFDLWESRDEVDAKMYEIRRMFHKVTENSFGPSDLFVSFFSRKIDQLDDLLVDATTKQEVRIDETMFQVTSELLYSAFDGRSGDIFRALHYCADNDFFFDIHSRRYFRQAYDLLQARKIKQIKRLIVYSAECELQDDKTKLLVAFHSSNKHYDCRLLSVENFNRILDDFGLHYLMRDFGIYGESYLYKAYVNRRDKIIGSYSKNPNEIRRCIECFEACWISPSAIIPKALTGGQKVLIDELLARDPVAAASSSGNVLPLPKGALRHAVNEQAEKLLPNPQTSPSSEK